ncbi:MAG: hypothetical protein AAGA90_03490 [Actinomycetota bacterium]
MSRRELLLVGVILILVGVVAGFVLAALFGDDGETATDPVTTTAAPTTTEAVATSTTSTTTTSTTSSSTTSTTTSTTTTSTTSTTVPPAVEVAIVADLVSGEVLGLPFGSIEEEVEFALVEVFGAADTDSGWVEGCPFDGNDERYLRYDGLTVAFYDVAGDRQYDGWSWRPSEPVPVGSYPVDPQPDTWEIRLHDGVSPGMTMAQIGAVVGVAPEATLGFSVIRGDAGWGYVGESDDDPPFQISSNLWFCD